MSLPAGVPKGSVRDMPSFTHAAIERNGAPPATSPVDPSKTWIGGFMLQKSLMLGEVAGVFTLTFDGETPADSSEAHGRLQYTRGKWANTVVAAKATKTGGDGDTTQWTLKVGAFELAVAPLVSTSHTKKDGRVVHAANGNVSTSTPLGSIKGSLGMGQVAMKKVGLEMFR